MLCSNVSKEELQQELVKNIVEFKDLKFTFSYSSNHDKNIYKDQLLSKEFNNGTDYFNIVISLDADSLNYSVDFVDKIKQIVKTIFYKKEDKDTRFIANCEIKFKYDEIRKRKEFFKNYTYTLLNIFNPFFVKEKDFPFIPLSNDEKKLYSFITENFYQNKDLLLFLVLGNTQVGKSYTTTKSFLDKIKKEIDFKEEINEENYKKLENLNSKYLFITESNLAKEIKENFLIIPNIYEEVEFLIIDEIKRAVIKQDLITMIENLITDRYANLKKTILISNSNLQTIEKYYADFVMARIRNQKTSRILIMNDKLNFNQGDI